jgi:hypothetical protein
MPAVNMSKAPWFRLSIRDLIMLSVVTSAVDRGGALAQHLARSLDLHSAALVPWGADNARTVPRVGGLAVRLLSRLRQAHSRERFLLRPRQALGVSVTSMCGECWRRRDWCAGLWPGRSAPQDRARVEG